MSSVPTTVAPNGFKPWWITPPPMDATHVAYWRYGMTEPKLTERHVNPEWNVYGVYWGPVSKPIMDRLSLAIVTGR